MGLFLRTYAYTHTIILILLYPAHIQVYPRVDNSTSSITALYSTSSRAQSAASAARRFQITTALFSND